jgi:hypothetical protein
MTHSASEPLDTLCGNHLAIFDAFLHPKTFDTQIVEKQRLLIRKHKLRDL